MVGVVLLSAGDIRGLTVVVIHSWRAAGWGLVQVSWGIVVLVLGSSSGAGPGSGDHSVHLALYGVRQLLTDFVEG